MADEYNYQLGSLEINDEILTKLMENGDIEELKNYLRQGRDPRTNELVASGTQQYQNLMNAPAAYGQNELQTFRDLISGDFFTNEMAGSFRDRISREMQPKYQEAQSALSARGLGTSGGEQASMLGRLASEENKGFQDVAAQNFLQAIGYGTQGLGAADTAMMNRTQMGYGMGADIRNFLENSDMNRLQFGAQLANLGMSNDMNLLQLNQGTRQYQQSQPSTLQQIGAGIAPFVPMAFGMPPLQMFSEGQGNGTIGSGGNIGNYL